MEFCASYGGLLLNPALAGTFPQSEWAAGRGACQLLDAMRTMGGIPHGYLERLATRCEDEGLDEIAGGAAGGRVQDDPGEGLLLQPPRRLALRSGR